MKIKQMAERLNSVPVRKKAKRILAVTLAVLMVNPVTGYGVTAHAQEMGTITAFGNLSSEIATQQLAVGAEESDINLPDTLSVTLSVYGVDTAENVVEDSQTEEIPTEEAKPDESTPEEPAADESPADDSSVSGNDAEEPQEDDGNGAEDNTATDSEAIVVLDSGEVPLAASTTGSAISVELDDADTEQTETETITTEDRTLTGITWQINAERSGSDTFNSENAGAVFFYEPVLPEGYTLADGVSLPQIQVKIEENVQWAFSQSTTIDGIEITVKAEKDVFPEGAVLRAEKVTNAEDTEKIQDAVSEEVKTQDAAKTVTKLISFDITITDAEGNELQPDTSKGEVRVSFAQLPMVTEDIAPTQELKVFHMDDSLSEAKGLNTTVNQEAESVEATAEHFTVYTVAQLTDEIRANVEAEIKDSDDTLTYYDTIEEAITAAMGMSGSTVTLLKNVATENRIEISTGNFSIDLNGNTWTGPATWEVDGHTNCAIEIVEAPTLVMKDTVGGGVFTSTNETKNVIFSFSSIANISIEGGTYSGISNAKSVDNLLADGYVYRNSENGELITDLSSNKILNVTVTPAPVKITAQPENFNADEATVSLSLTAESVPADSGKEISYQWYKEDGTAIEGATANVYTLPEDPSARLDSYYCAASCDGYTVNSRIVSSFFYEVTAADGTVTNYDTIEQAITAAQGMSGSTVTLLKDVATDNAVNITSGTFTLDLNGKAWTNTDSDGSGVLQLIGSSDNTASLIVKDSAGGGSITTTASGVYSIFGNTNYSLSLEGGSYTGIWASSNQVGNVLADGYVYKNKESGELVTDMSSDTISNVTVTQAPIEMMSVSVTEADGTVHNYFTIEKAITAAQSLSGSTVTLLKDVATESSVYLTSGILTIDLAGKSWSCTSGYVIINDSANVTFIDSGSGGKIVGADNFTVVIGTGGTLRLEGGTYQGGTTASIYNVTGNIGSLLPEGYVYIQENGTAVTDMSSDDISNVTVRAIPVTITTQPGDAVAAPGYTEAPTFAVMAETVPADSGETITYQWYKDSVAIDSATNASYTVEPNLGEGTYTYHCTVTCDGYSVNTENATLFVTSATGNYSVTASSGNTVSYPTLETAITAAKSKPNSTVKLLADATTAEQVEVSSGTFTIDLNGKIWTSTTSVNALSLKNGCHVTLMDSDTGGKLATSTSLMTINVQDADLTIKSGIYENENSNSMSYVLGAYSSGTVTIEGGTIQTSKNTMYLAYLQSVDVVISGGIFSGSNTTFHNCDSVALSGGEYKSIGTNNESAVTSLLASGYGYKNVSNNTWVNRLANSTSNANDLAHYFLQYPVTVQPVPVQITDQPQNATSTTYGYTEVPTMSVAAEKTTAAPMDSTITYQWYRVKSGSETSDTALGTTATLTLPTGLDAGTHSFYCAVTCDGYIVNSESATFTVEKATPTITLEVIVYEDEPFIYGNLMFFTATVTGANGEYPDGTVTLMDGNEILMDGWGSSFEHVAYSTDSQFYQKGSDKIAAGNHRFTAIYHPSTDGTGKNYVSVTSTAVEQSIDKADQAALSITEVIDKKYGDADFTLETTGGSGTGVVTYSVPENNGVISVSGDTATIIGAGTVTVTATRAADTNYNVATATRSITIAKADTSVVFNSSYAGNYYYTGSPISNPVAADLIITGATYSNAVFVWYDSSNNQLDTPPTAPGSYILAVSIPENDYLKPSSNTKSVTIGSYDGTVTVAYNGSTTKAAWYTGDVQLSADGYTVSDSADGTFASSYLLSGEGVVSKTLYFKENGTGYITDGKFVSINIDKTAPTFSADTDGITISDNNWKGFLNNITFGHFFKETKDVSISATDSGSGVNKYYYYIDTGSTTAKTADELNALSFTEGSSFSIADENKYIIYAYAVDLAGNKSAYICTDGIVIDKTAPTVTLTAPMGSDLGDVAGEAKVKMNETGIISYVIKNTEQSGMTAQNILDSTEKKTVSVTDGRADKNLYVALSGLTANTTYYMYAVGTDSAGNNSEVKSISFITKKTTPLFDSSPTITGTYGQQVKDMTMFQPTCTNGVAGSWSVSSIAVPSVGSTEMYEVKFTPEDASKYEWISWYVKPTVLPKSLTAAGVTIGEVTGTYTYDKTEKVPTVIVTDSEATITASDYEYSYSNNVSAGTATVTVTAKGNYNGSVSRTFTIAKASISGITFPTAGGLTYGQKLSASILTGGSTEYGTFAWTNGDTVPTVANSGYDVTFAPSAEATANYEISTRTEAVSVTVSKADPVTSVSAEISGNAGSRQATLTATLTGSGDGDMPAGTIQFVNTTGGSTENIGSAVTLVNGTASFEWTGLADQAYTVKAVYSGSGNYNTAESSELEVDTRKQNQAAFSIGSISPKTYGDGSFTLSATGGSGAGAITFESSDSSIVSISGSTATIHKAGTVAITATKAEDATFNAATATASQTIAKKTLSIGTGDEFSLSTNSYTYNGSAREPAVTIKLDGKTLAKDADYTVTYSNNINAGTALVSITGMGNYQGTLESNFTIAKAGQAALSITEVIGKKYLDGTFTLTTSGGSGTGAVTYSVPENNSVLSVSGDTVTIIGVGTVTVTATKAADDNYNSITATREITVGKAAAPSITYPTASSITYGQKLSVSTLSGGSTQYGTFVWTNSSTIPTVTNSGYDVTFTPNANTMANYEAITGTTHTVAITVSKATPAVTVSADISDDEGSRKATLTATVTGAGDGETPTGTVKFVNSTSGSDVDIAGATAVTITGGKATYTWIGLASQIYKVKAIYSGSGNYNTGTSTELSFDTNKQNQAALRIGSIGTKTYGDGTFTLSATGGSGGGAVIFESSDPTIVSISGTTATIHKAGTVTINATKAADNTYNEATASVSLTVGKKALTIKANDQLNIIKGAAIPTLTYTVTGIVDGDTFTSPSISTTATDTNTVGEYDITISGGTLANADSYAVTYTNGKLTVVNATYTVTVTNGTGGGSYSEGQTVTITADSRGGYTFTGWSSSDGVTFASNTASTTTFTMPGKAVTVTANYSKNSSGDSGNSNGGSTTNNTNSNNDTTNANQSNVGKSAVTGTGANQNITGATQGETDRQTEKSSQSEGNKPYLAGEEEKSGWEAIMTEIKETSDQESQEPGRIMVEMNGGTIIPANVIASIRGKNLNLVLDMGDGITWTINGMDVSEDALLDIDLGVTKKTSVIPEDVVNRIRGENRSIQIELAHNGAFGFKATLTIAFDKGEVGKFANLFYYNEETGKLEYLESTQVEEDGKATLTFVHASAYTIVLSNVAMDESAVGSLTEKENQTENSTKTDSNEVQATEETSGNMMVFWILLGIIVVVVIGGTTIYTRRKNDRKEDNEA